MTGYVWHGSPALAFVPPAPVPPALLADLDRFDAHDPILAALGVLDLKLGVVVADMERLVRVLGAVAGAVDVRIEVGP